MEVYWKVQQNIIHDTIVIGWKILLYLANFRLKSYSLGIFYLYIKKLKY